MYLFQSYHNKSKNKLANKVTPKDMSSWPPEWKAFYYKDFKNKNFLKFPEPKKNDKHLIDVLLARKSKRVFNRTIDEQTFSELLYFSLGEFFDESEQRMRRFYPSGGARYPVESYVLIFKPIGNIPTGIYHYAVNGHGLHQLESKNFSIDDFDKITIYDFVKEAQFMIIFTASFDRSAQKYGERAYRYILLEAGAIMQNVCLLGESYGINVLPMAGAIDDSLEEMIKVDREEESIVNAVVFG